MFSVGGGRGDQLALGFIPFKYDCNPMLRWLGAGFSVARAGSGFAGLLAFRLVFFDVSAFMASLRLSGRYIICIAH
jgi:hypothetical protein